MILTKADLEEALRQRLKALYAAASKEDEEMLDAIVSVWAEDEVEAAKADGLAGDEGCCRSQR